ncbi:hypothetical protein Tco_0204946 [Tanacetum coccineum]
MSIVVLLLGKNEQTKLDESPVSGVTKIVLLGLESIPLTSRFIGTRGCVFNKGLFGVESEQDELPSSVRLNFRARLDGGRIIEVTKLTTGLLVNGSSCDGIDMVIKDLDLEPKDIIAEFCNPSRWKELSKESGSKILPCRDGSCWKTFKLIASLIA